VRPSRPARPRPGHAGRIVVIGPRAKPDNRSAEGRAHVKD
jgi:hypothetical protein